MFDLFDQLDQSTPYFTPDQLGYGFSKKNHVCFMCC